MQMQVLDKRNILSEEVVTYGDIENPLFLAKDVAIWIDHNKPSEMIMNVDEDEKLKAIVSHSGQNREMWFLTEDGLYEVLMQSRKPIAKKFKKKIKKLLKEIRLKEIRLKEYKDPFRNLSPEIQAIMIQDKQIQEVQKEITTVKDELIDLRDNAPLFNVECDEISKSVKSLGVRVLGGKDSNAYKDNSIRSQVYSDIYEQIKRQFGVKSYKAIKRGQLQTALNIIEQYKVPLFLQDLIKGTNNQLMF